MTTAERWGASTQVVEDPVVQASQWQQDWGNNFDQQQAWEQEKEWEAEQIRVWEQEAWEEELGRQWEMQQAAGAASSSTDRFHSPEGKIDKAMSLGFSLKT